MSCKPKPHAACNTVKPRQSRQRRTSASPVPPIAEVKTGYGLAGRDGGLAWPAGFGEGKRKRDLATPPPFVFTKTPEQTRASLAIRIVAGGATGGTAKLRQPTSVARVLRNAKRPWI